MASIAQEFKAFVLRGNVIDLAVGVIIGAAFSGVVNSIVTDIIMPPIGWAMGGVDFSNLFVPLGGGSYETLAAAQEAGAATINYGKFLNAVINFLIVAIAMFLVIKQVNFVMRFRPDKDKPADPTTKDCPYCMSTISIKATRCPNCTSQLEQGSAA